MDLKQFQKSHQEWAQYNFPNRKPYQPLLGVSEEVGELCHAHLKLEQGIRGTPEEHQAAKEDAVGDIIIYLIDYCTLNGIDIGCALEKTWAEVSKRDWVKFPRNGVSE